jgi:hypothetical protein|nr:hypothetical protein Q903MT_gene3576 [Picea sitchensis]
MSHNRTLFFLSLTCLGDFASPLLVARWESILVASLTVGIDQAGMPYNELYLPAIYRIRLH